MCICEWCTGCDIGAALFLAPISSRDSIHNWWMSDDLKSGSRVIFSGRAACHMSLDDGKMMNADDSLLRWPIQILEEALVHSQRQLPLLLRVHDRQRTERNHSPGKHSGISPIPIKSSSIWLCLLLYWYLIDGNCFDWRFQVREVQDRNKPNCFELYATGGNDFIKGSHCVSMREREREREKMIAHWLVFLVCWQPAKPTRRAKWWKASTQSTECPPERWKKKMTG